MWALDSSPFNFTSFMQLNFSPLPNLQNKILVPLHINPGSSSIQFHHVKNITSQHISNYSTTHIINQSEIFPSVNYTFHSIYSNTNPSTKSNWLNNLFKHSLGGLNSTSPFSSFTTISPCQKYYISTWSKLFNYTHNFYSIKIILFIQLYFSLNIF